jgi:outer membrane biosynthesis protein TonB
VRHLVNRLIKNFAAALIAAGLALSADRVEAGSVGDFFKALGNSIAHPGQTKKQPPPKPSNKKAKTKGSEQAPDYPPEPIPVPTPTPTAAASQPPVRPASAPSTKNSKRDIPYAIPVPNKPGFVTSPYSPKAGYVDVRGFASGTEVKDPYSGKVFLTP